jgi:carbonic anhydrase/acetyltransferase-like protein (isoleucine patch superfamily)
LIHPLNFYNENDEIVLKEPCIGTKAFVAETATLIGDVSLGEDVSIWYNTVLRGDVMPIEIGARSNIQDQCMLHGTFKQFAVKIGEEVTVGHGVTLHGCTIEDQCFIGMDSTIMDGVHIEKNCFVAAGSLLSPGKRFPSGSMIMGRPAKVVRELTDKEYKEFVASYKRYVKYKDCYLNNQTNEK